MILRGATDICIQERNKNALTTAAANVAQTMISFGFQSNIQKLRDVAVPAALVLDGSTDVEKHNHDADVLKASAELAIERALKSNFLKIGDQIKKRVVYQALEDLNVDKAKYSDILPRSKIEAGLTHEEFVANYVQISLGGWDRWKNSGVEWQQVCILKRNIIRILMDVSNLRANYRVARMLHFFKSSVLGDDKSSLLRSMSSKSFASMKSFSSVTSLPIHPDLESERKLQKKCALLKKMASDAKDGKIDKGFDSKLFARFEMLFVENDEEDAWQLDLGEVSKSENLKKNFGDLLVDILMYEDDALFADAFALLSRRFGQRRKLRDALQDVILRESPWWKCGNVENTLDNLQEQISFLLYTTRSYEMWGVKSRLSGAFDEGMFEKLKGTCETICSFLDSGDDDQETNDLAEKQLLLRGMNLAQPLRVAIKIKPDISRHGSICEEHDKEKSTEILLDSIFHCLNLLHKYVKKT